ncbi:ABC transporter ATP-binding protein [Candidatus Korarchaeum cryptofilum]|jgi:peptide/nickel transport system ATP-binding protein|uniref:Nickel import system ATP-binding protein NikD n=1 Tax=Candidatus Korarchaeum cryptofilum TaxID=498846 RepID=A0A429G2H9_9CREN|nr:ABC transporter ATP-binding protein [Candidatus Korarchaeum cryptofilum]RSN68027.1 ABC transporter ATP-binding protein [Candidatus Korarchaeum cryptofilum]
MEPLLQIKDLRTYFFTSRGKVRAVDGVDLSLYEREVLAVVGETGCGKSTLGLSIMRLVPYPGRIVGGEIFFKGRDLLKVDESELRKIRGKEIAMIFQNPSKALNPVYKVGYQIAEMPRYHLGAPMRKAWEFAVDLLRKVKIPDPEVKASSYPHSLSGGMKQRSLIAMMISLKPSLLIADEPTTALDVTVQAQIMDLLREIREEVGMAVMLITHNIGLVAEESDRVAVMYAGKIVEVGATPDVLEDPLHPYTKGLLSSLPSRRGRKERVPSIPGNVPDLINPPSGCRFNPRCPYKLDICDKEEPELSEVRRGHLVSCFAVG